MNKRGVVCESQHNYTCTKDTPKRLMPTHPERFEMKPNVAGRAGTERYWGAVAAAVSGLVSALL